MRSITWILCALIVSTGSFAAEETPPTPANSTAGTAADPDYIPPSTAIFSGIDTPSPPQQSQASSGERFSQSVNKALNVAPKEVQQNGGGQASSGPKPLEVAPLAVPPSPDKNENGNVKSSVPKKENIPEELLTTVNVQSEADLPVIQIYSQEELIALINENKHLERVEKIDECQLVTDIEARAKVVMLPAYQYLWGDMQLTGTCTAMNIESGIEYLWKAAQQGMPAALEQLGRYYSKGRYVQKDQQQAAVLMHEAAAQGYLKAQITWVDMLVKGLGSPLDYEEAYSWLHHSVIADEKQHKRATQLLARLASKMPPQIVNRAKVYRWQ